jgi:hypothetical protein
LIATVEDEETKRVRALPKKVVKGSTAYQCCRSNQLTLYSAVNSALTGIADALGKAGKGSALAFVPGTRFDVGRIITIAETAAEAAAVLGQLVVIAGASLLATLAVTAASYDMLSVVGAALGQIISEKDPGCLECIERGLLSQKHPRKREETRILRRL